MIHINTYLQNGHVPGGYEQDQHQAGREDDSYEDLVIQRGVSQLAPHVALVCEALLGSPESQIMDVHGHTPGSGLFHCRVTQWSLLQDPARLQRDPNDSDVQSVRFYAMNTTIAVVFIQDPVRFQCLSRLVIS